MRVEEGRGTVKDGALASLTARMARQDEAAFVEFLNIFRDRLFRYAIVLNRGDEENAKEAMQQTMVRVVRHIRTFDDEDIFWSWLTRIIRSVVIDDARKRTRHRTLLDRFFGQRRTPQAEHVSTTDSPTLLNRLEARLPELSPSNADLIRRKYFLGETSREIAVHLNTTEKAIESRLVRIRRRLRESILKEANDE